MASASPAATNGRHSPTSRYMSASPPLQLVSGSLGVPRHHTLRTDTHIRVSGKMACLYGKLLGTHSTEECVLAIISRICIGEAGCKLQTILLEVAIVQLDQTMMVQGLCCRGRSYLSRKRTFPYSCCAMCRHPDGEGVQAGRLCGNLWFCICRLGDCRFCRHLSR